MDAAAISETTNRSFPTLNRGGSHVLDVDAHVFSDAIRRPVIVAAAVTQPREGSHARLSPRSRSILGARQRGQTSRMQLRKVLRNTADSARAYVWVIWPRSRYTIALLTTIGH